MNFFTISCNVSGAQNSTLLMGSPRGTIPPTQGMSATATERKGCRLIHKVRARKDTFGKIPERNSLLMILSVAVPNRETSGH